MNEIENFFFGRMTVKIFEYSRENYVNAITEKKISAFRLFLASLFLGLGKLIYQIYILEVNLINFLSFGGIILITFCLCFMCYLLSTVYLGL